MAAKKISFAAPSAAPGSSATWTCHAREEMKDASLRLPASPGNTTAPTSRTAVEGGRHGHPRAAAEMELEADSRLPPRAARPQAEVSLEAPLLAAPAPEARPWAALAAPAPGAQP